MNASFQEFEDILKSNVSFFGSSLKSSTNAGVAFLIFIGPFS